MVTCILLIFALSLAAPLIHRAAGGATNWLLGAVAAGVTAYIATYIPVVEAEQSVILSHPWAPSLGLEFSLLLDGLSLLFALIITGIGALILIYAGSYLSGHSQLGAFYAYILLFIGSMLGVVVSNNLILLFIFWELTSISSYLLIGFDHERPAARAAALQALLVTGAGGLALLAGLVLLYQVGGSMELSELFAQRPLIREHALYLPILVLVFAGAFTKSAQFPFHFWLPNAMEAPTPVSAYLHSATMVKAGVFLLARMTPILGGTEAWSYTIIAVGAATMLIAAAMAMAQTAMKRILAYSTVSVLGALTLLLGIGTELAIQAAVVYLAAHALYKGALFLMAGTVSHATEEIHADRLGGLWRAMPLTAVAAVLAALSMAGLPPLFGFVGKEILYDALQDSGGWSTILVSVGMAASALLFAVALFVGVKPFFGRLLETPHHPHEGSPGLWSGSMLLALAGLAAGFFPNAAADAFLGLAASATLGEPTTMHLKLWHGWTATLALSALTVVAGLILFVGRSLLFRSAERLSPLALLGPEGGYRLLLRMLHFVANWQTRILQCGNLRIYVLITLSCVVAAVGLPLFSRGDVLGPAVWSHVRFYEFLVAVLIVLATVVVVRTRSRLTAVAGLGGVGYGVTLIFVFYSAPDLAMTQFLIETMMIVLFVFVLYRLPRFGLLTGSGARVRDAVVATVFGALMGTLVLATGAAQSDESVSEFFIQHSYSEAHGRNIVNVILVDFRALDTLGEITVLAIAAIGVFGLIKLRPKQDTPR